MPNRAPTLNLFGRSKISEAKRYERERGTSWQRGYDTAWDKLRLRHLKSEPLCRYCFRRGLIVAAQEVDHIIPIRDDPERRLDDSNLQSLCKSCHSAKTMSEMRRRVSN